MHGIRTIHAIALCILAVACAPATPPAPKVQFVPDAQGLAVVPGGQRVDFGRSPNGVMDALDRELGSHQALSLDNCPDVITDQARWGDLVLTFTDERFVGWRTGAESRGTICAN